MKRILDNMRQISLKLFFGLEKPFKCRNKKTLEKVHKIFLWFLLEERITNYTQIFIIYNEI